MTLFQALYGRHPPSIASYTMNSSSVAVVDDLLRQHKKILATTKYYLSRVRLHMKQDADSRRTHCFFVADDWVLLRLQPYRQLMVHRRSSIKLSRHFYGPFRIVKHIGQIAYKLALPIGSHVHPIFHFSLLQPFDGDPPFVIDLLPFDV
ncbi:UNVERIFIED_CONTAM: hypothetical protein Sradi_5422100 [Sesamum radiatum]|uniref:Tf2-1-like SH3-like domain-containing protein n=1 Tax=Sesamum radiatum TaxID=300843 RepID=A0AAW2L8Q5_SESRA